MTNRQTQGELRKRSAFWHLILCVIGIHTLATLVASRVKDVERVIVMIKFKEIVLDVVAGEIT